MLENGARRVAIEIDDETSHNKSLIASNKFYDDLLKQNSMVYLGWDVYRWAVRQMQIQPEAIKDELRTATQERSDDNMVILEILKTPRTSWISRPPWRSASWYLFAVSASTPTST